MVQNEMFAAKVEKQFQGYHQLKEFPDIAPHPIHNIPKMREGEVQKLTDSM